MHKTMWHCKLFQTPSLNINKRSVATNNHSSETLLQRLIVTKCSLKLLTLLQRLIVTKCSLKLLTLLQRLIVTKCSLKLLTLLQRLIVTKCDCAISLVFVSIKGLWWTLTHSKPFQTPFENTMSLCENLLSKQMYLKQSWMEPNYGFFQRHFVIFVSFVFFWILLYFFGTSSVCRI